MVWNNSAARSQPLIPVLLSIIAGLLLATVARWLSYSDPYLAFALGGATIFYARVTVSCKEWLVWSAALLVFAAIVHFPATSDPILWIATLCALTGFASFLMLCLRCLWCDEPSNKVALALLAPATLLVLYILSAQHALNLAGWLHPTTLDLYLFSFDGSLGFQPSFWIAAGLRQHKILGLVSLLSYVSLPLAMGAAYAGYIDPRAIKPSPYMLKLFVLAGLLGWCLYNFFPATGPVYAFQGDFPYHPLPFPAIKRIVLEPIALPQSIPRNAMPSLHMAWVILIWWNSSKFPRFARFLVFCYLILTVMGTLGTGEHYLVDLVVAFPFALAVQSLCVGTEKSSSQHRWKLGATIGFAITCIWFATLRFAGGIFQAAPLIPWFAVVITIATVEILRKRLGVSQPCSDDNREAIHLASANTSMSWISGGRDSNSNKETAS